MKLPYIQYHKIRVYKYRLIHTYEIELPKAFTRNLGIRGYAKSEYTDINQKWEEDSMMSGFVYHSIENKLLIRKGYAWDGPSGPTLDTRNFMRASLVHDALYQLIREKFLPSSMRLHADKLLKQLCIEDGMSWFRAHYVYLAVHYFGKSSAIENKQMHQIFTAP